MKHGYEADDGMGMRVDVRSLGNGHGLGGRAYPDWFDGAGDRSVAQLRVEAVFLEEFFYKSGVEFSAYFPAVEIEAEVFVAADAPHAGKLADAAGAVADFTEVTSECRNRHGLSIAEI